MTIKRYTPKYKILAKLRQALWLNKRAKIQKFKRQKWDGKIKLYFSRKRKFFDQDSSSYPVASDFSKDRITRLKRTYKYLLQDKQAFQLYYGERRFKLYQLKRFAIFAKKLGQKKKLSAGKVLFHNMENRLEVCLCRLGFVSSLMQARKLLASDCIKQNHYLVKNFGSHLSLGDFIRVDKLKSIEILARCLRYNIPSFYFRKRELRKIFLVERTEFIKDDILAREHLSFLNFFKSSLSKIKA